jgi:hypothetical protein
MLKYSVWIEGRGFYRSCRTIKEARSIARKLAKAIMGDAVFVNQEESVEVYRVEGRAIAEGKEIPK